MNGWSCMNFEVRKNIFLSLFRENREIRKSSKNFAKVYRVWKGTYKFDSRDGSRGISSETKEEISGFEIRMRISFGVGLTWSYEFFKQATDLKLVNCNMNKLDLSLNHAQIIFWWIISSLYTIKKAWIEQAIGKWIRLE